LIGPHLPLGNGLLKAARRAQSIGATAIQVFTDNPTAWRRRTAPPAELPEFRRRLREAGIGPLAVHAPYLVNLCGAYEDFWRLSVDTMANELRVGRQYGAAFVVMHIGSHRGTTREAGIQRLVEGLRAVLDHPTLHADEVPSAADQPLLVLENAAGTGDGIGATIEDLADIFDAAGAAGLPMARLAVCLDTAHLWGAGYDISGETGVNRLVGQIDRRLGRERVVMLHLNDSRIVVGSRLDRHEHIAAGQIGRSGMHELLNEPWLASLPTYLETPGMDSGYDLVNLERVRLILAGERLPDLPPDAFEMRGARTRTGPPQG
jgi:deoxyribonuclease-4